MSAGKSLTRRGSTFPPTKGSITNKSKNRELAHALAMSSAKLAATRGVKSRKGTTRPSGEFDDLVDSSAGAIKALRRWLNVESKRVNIQGSGAVLYTATDVDVTSNISQGDSDSQRDGDSIKIQWIDCNFSAEHNSAGTAVQRVRVMIVRSHDEKVTAAGVNAADGTSYAPYGHLVWDNKDQFTVLYDSMFTLNTYQPEEIRRVRFRCDQHVQYSAGGTTVASGAIQIMVWSGQSVNGPSFVYDAVLEYVDN